MESTEVIMWLVMRGALSANVLKVHQTYYLPSMTGIAVALYEPGRGRPGTERARP
jgi:gallate dioxygenase